jgi:multiple sugar transport system ATP-binding protein
VADITLTGVRKSFDETQVLNGVDLTVRTGEFLTLVGPSGCGKSTLLRIIAGLEAQTEGDVAIGGRSVTGVRASDRDLAMVFQSYALYPHLSVAENMATPLKLRDLTALQRVPVAGRFAPGAKARLAEIDGRVRETAEILQISHLLARKPGQLSGGQRQRAALGRAMVRQPTAFLMDEPLSNLDAALRVHMRAELAELHRRLDTTFIYVTHDQAEALTMSTRVAVMMDGDLLQLDTPDAVYADPADLRVAEFVGSPKINKLAGDLNADGTISVLTHRLPQRFAAPAQQVTVGFRPEHLELAGAEPARNAFHGVVTHRENLGADVFLHAAVADGRHPMTVRAEPAQAAGIAVGDRIAVRFRSETVLVFGADGKRLRSADEAARTRAVA